MEIYDQDRLVVVGIKGRSRSGKTTLAQNISRKISCGVDHIDHLAFAQALNELITIKRDTQGALERDRQLYAVHTLLAKLLGGSPLFGAPAYDELVELAYYIVDKPLGYGKPRNFMLEVARLLREYRNECFIEHTYNTMIHRRNLFLTEDSDSYIAILSDVRYKEEAEFIKSFHRNLIIEIDISFEELQSRPSEEDMVYSDVYSHESSHLDWGIESDYIIKADRLDEVELFEKTKEILEQERII